MTASAPWQAAVITARFVMEACMTSLAGVGLHGGGVQEPQDAARLGETGAQHGADASGCAGEENDGHASLSGG